MLQFYVQIYWELGAPPPQYELKLRSSLFTYQTNEWRLCFLAELHVESRCTSTLSQYINITIV